MAAKASRKKRTKAVDADGFHADPARRAAASSLCRRIGGIRWNRKPTTLEAYLEWISDPTPTHAWGGHGQTWCFVRDRWLSRTRKPEESQ